MGDDVVARAVEKMRADADRSRVVIVFGAAVWDWQLRAAADLLESAPPCKERTADAERYLAAEAKATGGWG